MAIVGLMLCCSGGSIKEEIKKMHTRPAGTQDHSLGCNQPVATHVLVRSIPITPASKDHDFDPKCDMFVVSPTALSAFPRRLRFAEI